MTALSEWESFYVIVGSCAGALIGLQFVVMTLVADSDLPTSEQLHGSVSTPTIVHFAVTLLLSALISAPWTSLTPLAALFASVALGGLFYVCVVARRLRRQTEYATVFEDWLFRIGAPSCIYAFLAAAAYMFLVDVHIALFAVALVALALLFLGIHDAWDAIIYLIMVRKSNRST